MKRMIAMLCFFALVLSGCGGSAEKKNETASTASAGRQYTRENFSVLPDPVLYEQGVVSAKLQTNLQGEPALYRLDTEYDDDEGDAYAVIAEYSLNSDGNWQTKKYFKKQLSARLRREELNTSIPFITRGDDGNLYALLRVGEDVADSLFEDEDEKSSWYYSVLVLDEANNSFQEVKLQTTVTQSDGSEVDYAGEYDATAFHVMEDGTFFVVFSGSAMYFDPESGVQMSFCESIPDSAFVKNVGYGESEFVYYSTARGKFGVLDGDSLEFTNELGDDIPEENRKYEWYFDTDTETWQMYAFNQSGLYRITDFGKKASTTCLSAEGNFDSLADEDATVYDMSVDNNENLYLLMREEAEDSTSYEPTWDYGIAKYTASESSADAG